MMDALLIAGKRLAEALRAENEALAKLDLSLAAKLAERKIAATDAFAQAYAAQAKHGGRPEGTIRQQAASLTQQLEALGSENRKLLERAISLQSRVIETIATAALPRIANPGYGPRGYQTPPRQAPALAVAARA
jgi:hypothetical protein